MRGRYVRGSGSGGRRSCTPPRGSGIRSRRCSPLPMTRDDCDRLSFRDGREGNVLSNSYLPVTNEGSLNLYCLLFHRLMILSIMYISVYTHE